MRTAASAASTMSSAVAGSIDSADERNLTTRGPCSSRWDGSESSPVRSSVGPSSDPSWSPMRSSTAGAGTINVVHRSRRRSVTPIRSEGTPQASRSPHQNAASHQPGSPSRGTITPTRGAIRQPSRRRRDTGHPLPDGSPPPRAYASRAGRGRSYANPLRVGSTSGRGFAGALELSTAVIGNVNLDVLIWPARDIPPPGAERPVERVDLRAGGGAAIAGATLARLGAHPIVVGCVGDDPAGDIVLEELRGYGVDASRINRGGEPTGVSVAFEEPGRDRSFLISLGCLAGFDSSTVPPDAVEADLVLICGYFNLPAMRGQEAMGLLRRVKQAGGKTLLDTGQDHDGWPARTREEILELLPLVDVFLPNLSEAELCSGEGDPLTAAKGLQRESGGWVVVKLGGDGCLAVGPGGQ